MQKAVGSLENVGASHTAAGPSETFWLLSAPVPGRQGHILLSSAAPVCNITHLSQSMCAIGRSPANGMIMTQAGVRVRDLQVAGPHRARKTRPPRRPQAPERHHRRSTCACGQGAGRVAWVCGSRGGTKEPPRCQPTRRYGRYSQPPSGAKSTAPAFPWPSPGQVVVPRRCTAAPRTQGPGSADPSLLGPRVVTS